MNINQGKKGISERVADYIKEQIRDQIYKVGERLPGEREMATQLKVSRNTVREAYKILEAYGYLKAKHGKGMFIATESEQIKKMTKSFFISSNHIIDLFDVRKVLEKSVVEWAIEKGNESQLIKLMKIVTESEDIIRRGEDILKLGEYDLQFHLCLAEMSTNQVAYRTMHHLIDLLAQARAHSIQIPNRAEQSVQEHRQIAEAIKHKDTEKAKKLMYNHLETIKHAIMKNIEK